MRKTTVAIGLVAVLLAPGVAAGDKKPDAADVRAAAAQCKSERGATKATREAFKTKYGGMSRCVRQKTAEEAEEREDARKNAAKECKAQRDEIGADDFTEKYGENDNGRNAYGKCVSSKAKAKKAKVRDS